MRRPVRCKRTSRCARISYRTHPCCGISRIGNSCADCVCCIVCPWECVNLRHCSIEQLIDLCDVTIDPVMPRPRAKIGESQCKVLGIVCGHVWLTQGLLCWGFYAGASMLADICLLRTG